MKFTRNACAFTFPCRFASVIAHLVLVYSVCGQSGFKDSLIRSNPVPPGAVVPFVEKIKTHRAYLESAAAAKSPLKQLFGYLYLYSDYYIAADYASASHQLLEAERIAIASNNPGWIGEIVSRKAVISIRTEKPGAAVQQFTEAVRLFGAAADTLRMAECIEQLGAAYIQTGAYDQALKQYQEALPLLEKFGSERHLRVAWGNYANLLLEQNQVALAITYFGRALAVHRKLGDREKEAQELGDLGNAYARLKNYDKAFEHYHQSIRIASALNMPEVLYVTYGDMAKTCEQQGNYYGAYDYLKKYHNLRDSIKGAETQEKLAELEVRFESKKKELALEKSQAELVHATETLKFWTFFAIFSSLNLALLIIIALKRRKSNARKIKMHEAQQKILRQELQLNAMEQLQLTEKFDAQKNNLTDLALDIVRKNDFVEELIKKMEALPLNNKQSTEHELRALQHFIRHHHRLNQERTIYQEKVDELNYTFFEKLNLKFAHLSQSEKQLCGLIRLNLSNKEIAVIKAISPNSAKIARYRLRKKLQLTEQDDIVAFLLQI